MTFCSIKDWIRQIKISVLPSETYSCLEHFTTGFTGPTFYSEKSDFQWLCDAVVFVKRPSLGSVLRSFLTDLEVMELLLSAFLIVQVLGSVGGYPSGAPTGACEDMLPRHTGVTPQSSPAPYRLLTNARTFQPGKAITGTVFTTASAPLLEGQILFRKCSYLKKKIFDFCVYGILFRIGATVHFCAFSVRINAVDTS